MRMILIALVAVATLWAPRPAVAVQPEEQLDDPALESRARDISKGLRCVVCQNESIDESNAEIAGDMRRLVRERLVAGDTDEQVVERLVSYYGEFVLLKPRFSVENALIWGAPPLALLIAGFFYLRRTGRIAGDAAAQPAAAVETGPGAPPLSPEEQARLDALMKD